MARTLVAVFAALMILMGAPDAGAHFSMLTPSDNIVTIKDDKEITLRAWFIDPHERMVLTMNKPKALGVRVRGSEIDLLASLEKLDMPDGTAYELLYRIKKPGDHIFHMTTAPYWDSMDGIFIIQDTKVVVNALGHSGGWEEPLGQTTEIVPLTRPYGLWVGNVFQGRVLYNGKPMAGVEVEVEYFNLLDEARRLSAPSTPYVTQSVLTDSDGVFTYAMPRQGWWGFAVTFPSKETKYFRDVKRRVLRGATFWVYALDIN